MKKCLNIIIVETLFSKEVICFKLMTYNEYYIKVFIIVDSVSTNKIKYEYFYDIYCFN